MTQPRMVSVAVWKETAQMLEEEFDFHMVGDSTEILTKVKFEKVSAEGRNKVLITVFLGEKRRIK